MATLTSIAACSFPTAGTTGHRAHGGGNHSGHWLITLYSTAFTLSLVCDLLVWIELLIFPQCVSETFRNEISTLLDPTSRLCYFVELPDWIHG